MQKLFILKDKADYFRFTEQGYTRCSLQKASVYPLSGLEKVKQLLEQLHADGVEKAQIFVLTITEELYEEEESRP